MPDGYESDMPEQGRIVSLMVIIPLVASAIAISSLFYNFYNPSTSNDIQINRKTEYFQIDLNNDSIKDLIIENNGKYDVYYGQKDRSFRSYDTN